MERKLRNRNLNEVILHAFDGVSIFNGNVFMRERVENKTTELTFLVIKYRSNIVGQSSHNLKLTVLNIRVCPTVGSGVTGDSSNNVGKKYCHKASLQRNIFN